MARPLLTLLLPLGLASCASAPHTGELASSIHHEVFISLNNPSDAEALITDTRELGKIPCVMDWAVSRRFDSGRSNVLADFDVGVSMGFASAADYQAYLNSPEHQAFLAKWRPRFKTVQIRDFGGR